MPEPMFPPRGHGVQGRKQSAPAAVWLDPATLPDDWTWQPGSVLLGLWNGREYGIRDDRHVVMLAGSRAGKTATVLGPNLRRYPGPAFIIDPKGELVRETAKAREQFGPVHVLDPFGATGRATSRHNPFDELRRAPLKNVPADAAALADALIIPAEKDPHWTDSARNLITGLVLYLYATDPDASLGTLRELLSETDPTLGKIFQEMTNGDAVKKLEPGPDADAFALAMGNSGTSFYSMMTFSDGKAISHTNEMSSILSTARQQTAPLDHVGDVVNGQSDFSLGDIGTTNATIYLVLPGMRLGTHSRWLRLVLMQAFAAMERNQIPRGKLPAWFVLEEFAALGHVRAIETAAGYLAGFGVKLWAVLQDLSQLKNHYRDSWETFLGNAGILMAFGNADATTTEYLSRKLGDLSIETTERNAATPDDLARGTAYRRQRQTVPLLAPFEVAKDFGRKTHRVLIHVADEGPLYLDRMPLPTEDAR